MQLGNRHISIGHQIDLCKLNLSKVYVVAMANLLLSTSVTLWLIWNTKRKKFEMLRMKDVGNTEGAQMRRQWIRRWQSRYWWTEWSSYQLNDLDSGARLPPHHDYRCRRFTRQTMQNTLNTAHRVLQCTGKYILHTIIIVLKAKKRPAQCTLHIVHSPQS